MNGYLPNDAAPLFGLNRSAPLRWPTPPPRSWWARLVASVRAAHNAFMTEWRS